LIEEKKLSICQDAGVVDNRGILSFDLKKKSETRFLAPMRTRTMHTTIFCSVSQIANFVYTISWCLTLLTGVLWLFTIFSEFMFVCANRNAKDRCKANKIFLVTLDKENESQTSKIV
jgi:hypothetical protein